jgi:hypothetical protein
MEKIINISEKKNISETRKKEVEKKLNLVNKGKLKRGHILWKYNTVLKTLNKSKYFEQENKLNWDKAIIKDFSKTKKVLIEENCIYFGSLNIKNAIKILERKHGIIYIP